MLQLRADNLKLLQVRHSLDTVPNLSMLDKEKTEENLRRERSSSSVLAIACDLCSYGTRVGVDQQMLDGISREQLVHAYVDLSNRYAEEMERLHEYENRVKHLQASQFCLS